MDAVVVGAGPAGATAAYTLAKAGCSIVLLDRRATIGEPNRCAEAVSVDGLAEAGVTPTDDCYVTPVSGSELHFPDGSVTRFTRAGACIRRPVLDRLLTDRAVSAGARLHTRSAVVGLETTESGWSVHTEDASFTTGFLIGAGGPRCPVARAVGQRSRTLRALQYKLPTTTLPQEWQRPWLQFCFDEAFGSGYAWAFPRRSEVSVGLSCPDSLRNQLDRYCARLGLDPDQRHATEGGLLPAPSRPVRICHHRALLAGDAGGFLAPLTKGGIYGAVWSGRLAGEMTAQAIRANDPSAIEQYPMRVAAHPSRDPAHLRLAQKVGALDNRTLNAIGAILDRREHTALPVHRLIGVTVRCGARTVLRAVPLGLAVRQAYRRSERFAW